MGTVFFTSDGDQIAFVDMIPLSSILKNITSGRFSRFAHTDCFKLLRRPFPSAPTSHPETPPTATTSNSN
jgi:hypothetical protein